MAGLVSGPQCSEFAIISNANRVSKISHAPAGYHACDAQRRRCVAHDQSLPFRMCDHCEFEGGLLIDPHSQSCIDNDWHIPLCDACELVEFKRYHQEVRKLTTGAAPIGQAEARRRARETCHCRPILLNGHKCFTCIEALQNVRHTQCLENRDWLKFLDYQDGKATERETRGRILRCRCGRRAPRKNVNAPAKICLGCEGIVLR